MPPPKKFGLNRARIDLAQEQRRASSPGDWQLAGSQDRLRAELDVIAYQRSQLLQAAGYPGRVTDVYAAEGEFVTVGAKLMQIGLLTDPEMVVYGIASRCKGRGRSARIGPHGGDRAPPLLPAIA